MSGLIEGGETGVEEVSEVFHDYRWNPFVNTALDMNRDETVEVLHRDAEFFAFEDDEEFSFEKIPDIFWPHIVQAKALKSSRIGRDFGGRVSV